MKKASSGSIQPRARQGAPNAGEGIGQNQRKSFGELLPAAGNRR